MKLRTHNCGELRKENENNTVKLAGWVEGLRLHGKVAFINLRDRYGITQVVVKEDSLLEEIKAIGNEWVIAVTGKVVSRPTGMENLKMDTGQIDVEAEKIEILSNSAVPPFVITDEITAKDELRLKYRYLDLRRISMQKAIIFKSKLMYLISEHLQSQDFINVETPLLGRSTPEGARDFLVPSRIHKGKFYSLVQSPQIYKQLLMIAGFEKYYQFARCMRDEDQRKDRQPEFTQLDIELSFIDEEEIFVLIEKLMQYVFSKLCNIQLNIPLRRMTYNEALETYGSDKPDLRYELYLKDVTELCHKTDFNIFKSAQAVKCLFFETDVSRKMIAEFENVAKGYGMGLGWLKYADNTFSGSVAKFFNPEALKELENLTGSKPGSLLFVAGERKRANEALGGIRNYIINNYLLQRPGQYEFTWITDFPMFDRDAVTKKLVTAHHAFVTPKDETNMESNPDATIGRLYDLVLNGVELGSGSIRPHTRELQEKILGVVGMDAESREANFGCLLKALEYGAPPHGGIALGVDRFTAILLGMNSIQDVIAFPKTLSGVGLLEDIPSEATEAQLEELSIKIKKDEQTKNIS
ncbi:MAG: aspartate--tRNA ligase [bacterium]